MKSLTEHLWFQVQGRRGFVNITPQVEASLAESGIREGLLLVILVFSAAITIVNPAFLTIENLFDLIRSSAGMAVLAVGFFLVLLVECSNDILGARWFTALKWVEVEI